ncbi:hypothetical protein AAMO2058_001085400 [Amorphochlora amoebiformis]
MEEYEKIERETEELTRILNHIIDRASERLLQKHFKRRAEEKTAQQAIESIYQTIELSLIQADPGEQNPTFNPRWSAEDEPPTCEIDRFARGVIPMRFRPKNQPKVINKTNPSALSRQNTGLGLDVPKRRNIVRNNITVKKSANSKLTRSLRVIQDKKGESQTSRLGRIADRKADKKDGLVPYELKEQVDEEEIHMDRLRETELRRLERRRRQELKLFETKRKAAEEEERLKNLQEELKGKPYTFDQDGNVILIKSLNAEKMPPISFEPKVNLKEKEEKKDVEEEEKKPRDKGRYYSRFNKKRKKKKKAKTQKEEDLSKYLERVQAEPNIMEEIELKSGVTIKDANSGQFKVGKEPEKNLNDTETLTRTEYTKLLDSEENSRLAKPVTGDNSPSHASESKDNLSEPNIAAVRNPAARNPAPRNPAARNLALSRDPTKKPNNYSGKKTSPTVMDKRAETPLGVRVANPAALASFGTAGGKAMDNPSVRREVVSGSRNFRPRSPGKGSYASRGGIAGRRRLRMREKQHFVDPLSSTTNSELDLPVDSGPCDPQDVDSFNQTILQDPSWGQNSSNSKKNRVMLRPWPKKASEKERAQVLGQGRAGKGPRDRIGGSNSQSKLPPPVYPHVQGHGFTKGYLATNNSSKRKKPRPKSPTDELKVSSDPARIFGSS